MARKKNKDGYVLKSEVQTIIQNYIRSIQMHDYSSDSGIPHLYAIMDMVDKVSIIDKIEDKWISVETGLPETMDNVLCLYEYRAMDGTHEGEMLKRYGIGYYFKQSKTWGGEVSYGIDTRVIAWMPLPKAYKSS